MRERELWIGVTAVLGTSLLWIAAVSGTVLLHAYADRLPAAAALLRALGHAVVSIGRSGGPAGLLSLAVAGGLLALLRSRDGRMQRDVRHG
ncbi:MAG TPA: hypothetical protein VMS88_03300 [Terriglobales bacterium]|nr:hypothetical protein [Terriglobales bacterium]